MRFILVLRSKFELQEEPSRFSGASVYVNKSLN